MVMFKFRKNSEDRSLSEMMASYWLRACFGVKVSKI